MDITSAMVDTCFSK